MLIDLSQNALELAMINQEPGSLPGEWLTALQTFTYFVAAPIGLFLGISFHYHLKSMTKSIKARQGIDMTNEH